MTGLKLVSRWFSTAILFVTLGVFFAAALARNASAEGLAISPASDSMVLPQAAPETPVTGDSQCLADTTESPLAAVTAMLASGANQGTGTVNAACPSGSRQYTCPNGVHGCKPNNMSPSTFCGT